MIKVLLFDFARVLLFPKDENYSGKLNDLNKTVTDEKHFKFEDVFYFNEELLDYLRTVKDKYKLVMFTSETIQDDLAVVEKLDGIFENIFSAKEMGFTKTDPEAYRFIVSNLQCNPNEILFIDDNVENVNSAKITGMKTYLFTDNVCLIKTIDTSL